MLEIIREMLQSRNQFLNRAHLFYTNRDSLTRQILEEEFIILLLLCNISLISSLTLTIKEATDLQNSLSIVMTRLSGNLDQMMSNNQFPDKIEIKVDGGKF